MHLKFISIQRHNNSSFVLKVLTELNTKSEIFTQRNKERFPETFSTSVVEKVFSSVGLFMEFIHALLSAVSEKLLSD